MSESNSQEVKIAEVSSCEDGHADLAASDDLFVIDEIDVDPAAGLFAMRS